MKYSDFKKMSNDAMKKIAGGKLTDPIGSGFPCHIYPRTDLGCTTTVDYTCTLSTLSACITQNKNKCMIDGCCKSSCCD